MSIFDIDIDQLAVEMLPPTLRTVEGSALATVLSSFSKDMYAEFLAFRAECIYYLTHDGQVCRIEKVLNDRFDSTERRIYVVDAPNIEPLYVYSRLEDKPLYVRSRTEAVPKLYVRSRAEIGQGGGFLVMVPLALVFDTEEMKRLVEQYKLDGQQFKIQTF